jgi:hypothetical protein|tara:strand:- start:1083 stop:2429 length:1347 start_codon:yes stop_codon:yes gene_type:complete
MAQWRKVVVSGSTAELNDISASGAIIPVTSDGGALGSAVLQWSDIFLAEGAVLNWDGGDFTATQANNLLTLSGGNTRVDRLEIDSANDYIDVDTDLKIVANSQIHLSASMVDIGANQISGSHASSGSFGYLNVHGDAIIKGDLTFGDANTDLITIGADIGSNLTPNTDATYDLGTTSQGWNDLHLGSGGVINLDGGDVTLTHAAGKLTWGGDGAVEIDFNNHEMTNVDIDSGAIDGTTIGAASHTTGKFTTLIATGDVDLGDATGDTITATGRFDSALVPSTDSARDLGTTGLYWANAYIDSITTTGDVTVNGSLDVNGTLTTIDSTNLRVADRFIIVASGSTSGDSGLIANTGAGGIGSAFFYDDSASRWALTAADDTSGSATTATPRQYLVSVSQSAAPPDDWEGGATQNPSDFGTDAATRRGMIYVQTSDHAGSRTLAGDIWIWS